MYDLHERTRTAIYAGNWPEVKQDPVMFNETAGHLFEWDGFGYEIAYYEVRILDDGTITDHTGECLCGPCATQWLDGLEADDLFGLDVALQINGEVGDCESVYCDDCGKEIYERPDTCPDDD